MKAVHGIWLPDHETHLLSFAGGPGWRYQWQKFNACLPWIKDFDEAIDVGAHCGLWSMQMRPYFQHVHAFEPLEAHRECFLQNMKDGYTLHGVALGAKEEMVFIKTPDGQSGDSHIAKNGTLGTIPVKRLDEFNIKPGFIKIDCEGYEYFVIEGGAETIQRWKPCIIVEQKEGRAQKYGLPEKGAVKLLQKMGATLREVISGDYILSWDAR